MKKKLQIQAFSNQKSLYDFRFEHDACGVAFITDIKGRRSHGIVTDALTALKNLMHRGACGCEKNTGDGAGIILQIPHEFFSKNVAFELPVEGKYGVGMIFLPQKASNRKLYEKICNDIIRDSGLKVLGWRDVPQNNSLIGPTAKNAEPVIRQVFVGTANKSPQPPLEKGVPDKAGDFFERTLYLVRRRIENVVLKSDLPDKKQFYIVSMSSQTIVYKGMLSADQITSYYPDLVSPFMKSAIAIVHQRFSTNTFPSWSLAHPFRFLAHNGEINTLQGNKYWMQAREHMFESKLLGKDIKDLLPVIQDGSDSASLDNVLELLVMTGRSLLHVMMMLIPEPWEAHGLMSKTKRAFYNYHSSLMEPWDGPAVVAFTDGEVVGAVLDRNGLRPGRYYVTKDDRVILASEVGVIDVRPENILEKGRLKPGRMFLVDTKKQRIIPDDELKENIAAEKPYNQWLTENRILLDDLPQVKSDLKTKNPNFCSRHLIQQQLLFVYTEEEKRLILTPMALRGEEAIGSMGNDTPLAVLSNKPLLLFTYFKQLFAQVTNPPLDAIREKIVTSLDILLGAEENLLEPDGKNCRRIELTSPILSNEQLDRISNFRRKGFNTKTLSLLFHFKRGGKGLEWALEKLFNEADEAIENGYTILILSDRGSTKNLAPIPSLIAVSGLHHHLVRKGTRTKVSFIISTGEAREVHHFCTLIGYGASAINPYLALDTIDGMIEEKLIDIDKKEAKENFIHAANKGILKVMSKMGISTLSGYRGAQIFEAVGLEKSFVDKYFTNTPSRIGGVGMDIIAMEIATRFNKAYPKEPVEKQEIEIGGEYKYRRIKRRHFYTPEIIAKLQHATRRNSFEVFKQFSGLVDKMNTDGGTIRGLLKFKIPKKPIPLSQVEPIEAIIKRFTTGAMSYGSISQEAHETMAIAMNRIGGKSNTGEGGEDPARYIPDKNGDSRRCKVKQVASARFGVTSEYLANADEIQIKMAQGAKPGEGGQLPGAKVYPWIAKVRHSIAGVTLISPPPHHDIYSIEDLAQLIYDLKNSNPTARINVKLAAEIGVGTVAAGVSKAHADAVLISGYDGGTGAAPLTSVKNAGIPWEIGLAETQQVLLLNNLRSRIVVQTDGQLKTGRDVAIAALLGAEEFGFGTVPLVILGCVMMRVCHLDTCPVGIATQNPELRKRFSGKPEYIENYFRFLAEELREYMAELGFRTVEEMVGRTDMLDFNPAVNQWKSQGIDLSAILHPHKFPLATVLHQTDLQDHGLEEALDYQLIKLAKKALDDKKKVQESLKIHNVNRTVGTMLGYEITKRYGGKGLPDDTIQFSFTGSAGQSFGAFIPKGLTLVLVGDANDHVGKGLSGGKIIVSPPRVKGFIPEKNILIGNVALYGATGGEMYVNGLAGERFAVRNSGALAAVEGVGDHGCEYMTGGRVVVLGKTGRNFAAGMSGGIAYVLVDGFNFENNINPDMVDLESIDKEDEKLIHTLIKRHFLHTQSPRAEIVLRNWKKYLPMFVKVMPKEYKRILEMEKEKPEIKFKLIPNITPKKGKYRTPYSV